MKLISIEDQIIQATISALLKEGYALSVNDGEETTVDRSRNLDLIFSAMKTTDEDYLLAYDDDGTLKSGYVRFIYGNDGADVVNDYTINLDPVMDEIAKMIAIYEEGG